MPDILYELPFPSSWLGPGPVFNMRLGHCVALEVTWDDEPERVDLIFDRIEAFKCTYYRAITAEQVEAAYDCVVSLGQTVWLQEISAVLKTRAEDYSYLRHLMIYFDDGPCYEFICGDFRVELIPGTEKP